MEDNLDLNYIFKKKVIKELISRYDYIKTLIQENLHKLDEDDFEENNINNPYEKRCMEIIERIKFLFDILRKSFDRSVNNLAVYIDKFFRKRKIDIRVDIKVLKENIKENEEINIQRNKEIKDTLEDLKFKIKGYSAKKERMINNLNEIEKIEGKKLLFDEENDKEEKKENMSIEKEIENKNNNENNISQEKEEKEEDEVEEEEDKNKQRKIIGIKRLRKGKSEVKDDKKGKEKKEKIKEKEINKENIRNKKLNKQIKNIINLEENDENLEIVEKNVLNEKTNKKEKIKKINQKSKGKEQIKRYMGKSDIK